MTHPDDAKEAEEMYKSLKELSKTFKSIDEAVFIQSGSVVLDALLGGGIPRGTFILWTAENGCGKSTGCLHTARAYCLQGLRVLYLDYEGGVNDSQIDGMELRQFLYDPDTNPKGTLFVFRVHTYKDGEQMLDNLMDKVDLVVIDSVTAMLTEKVKKSSAEDVLPGIDARVASTFLKKYKAEAVRNGVSWIMINQVRTKISFTGSSDGEAGGNALKHYTDIKIMMKRAFKDGKLTRDEETANGKQKVPYGAICDIWATKSRYTRPMIPLKLAVIFGKGISNEWAYGNYLINEGSIKKNGAWFNIQFLNFDEKVNGMNNVIRFVGKHRDEIRDYINSQGGYKLLLNSDESIDVGGVNFNASTQMDEDFDTLDGEELDRDEALDGEVNE